MRKVCGTLLAGLLSVATLAANEPTPAPGSDPAIEVDRAHEKEWEIRFDDGITLEEYARQLDYFEIEVAAVSKAGRVEYIARLTKPRPEKRIGQRSEEVRLYLGWKSGELHAADRRLLRKAGIATAGKELTHYFPTQVQRQMEDLEIEFAGHEPRDIELTRFQIQANRDDGGYEFVVIDQLPPRPNSEERQASASAAVTSEP